MMLAQVHFPDELKPEELDRYLADGWFRMGQTIFTTNFLNFKQQFYSAVWLRINLEDFEADKNQRKLARMNAQFRVEIKPAQVTLDKEVLFMRYRSGVTFEASSSLHQLLYGRSENNIFSTYEIVLYDNNRLIACGFFDLGKKSAAGITSFYDPDYKKNSLGRYLIFLKAAYCAEKGYRYFYPGYFVPGYPAFDYKLKMNAEVLQYYSLKETRWVSIDHFSEAEIPLRRMQDKLLELQQEMKSRQLPSKILKYDFFDAALVPELSHLQMFDFPVFLHYEDLPENRIRGLIVFDVRDEQYHWHFVNSLWSSKMFSDTDDHYSSHLLESDVLFASTRDAITMADQVSTFLHNNNSTSSA